MLDLRHLAEVEDYEKVVPCEVSMVEYSIEQGLGREIHKFINPGKNSHTMHWLIEQVTCILLR